MSVFCSFVLAMRQNGWLCTPNYPLTLDAQLSEQLKREEIL